MNVNKRYRQQNGTGQMETDGNKTEHIERRHQLDETRKKRKLERNGTGRGRIRSRDVNRRERDGNGT